MTDTSKKSGFKSWMYRHRIALLIIVLLIVAIRIALPFIILDQVNKKLAALDGYYGQVDDIDLALIRGAYVIKEVYIDKTDSADKDTTRFIDCERIDLSVQWKALFQGKIVGRVSFDNANVNYVKDQTVGEGAEEDTTDLTQVLKDLIPLDINKLEINNSSVKFIDNTSSPKVQLECTNIQVLALGLTNRPNGDELLPAHISFSGNLYGGMATINVQLDPLSKTPLFDLTGDFQEFELINFNEFFKAYANFDLKKGRMSMYTEVAAKDNKFAGYVKPLLKDLDVVQIEEEEGNALQIAWEAVVGTVAEVFQNQRKEQLATKVEFSGKFTDPNTDVLSAIFSLLRNAFIEALKPQIDDSVNISGLDGLQGGGIKEKKK